MDSLLRLPLACRYKGHTCAVQADGTLACFGYNYYGQCDVPENLGPITAVVAGNYHTCAVQANGTLVCCGKNHSGQCDLPEGLAYLKSLVMA